MAILGLIDAEKFDAQRFKNVRRSVFYFYPNGAATLTGIMSLVSEEVCNDPEYKWFEKRLSEQRTTDSFGECGGSIHLDGHGYRSDDWWLVPGSGSEHSRSDSGSDDGCVPGGACSQDYCCAYNGCCDGYQGYYHVVSGLEQDGSSGAGGDHEPP